MNILHIAPYLPSFKAAHAGGVCMAHEIETLRLLGHNVYSCAFYQERYDADYRHDENFRGKLFKLTTTKKICNCLMHPLTAPYFASRYSRQFYRTIIKIIQEKKINAIHAEYASMGLYIKIKKKYPNIIFNLVLHDVTLQSYSRMVEQSKGLRKIFLSMNKKLIYKNEKRAVDGADNVLTFCEKDSGLIKKYYNPHMVYVINTYFGLDKIEKSIKSKDYSARHGICFMGQMARVENENAAIRLIELYNQVKREIDDEPLYIIGGNPSNNLKKYESSSVRICGYVVDMEYVMNNCKIAVFPLNSGAGIKIKVLTSMALGLPTITSEVGAEGIDAAGECLNLATTDSDFKNAMLILLKNEQEYNKRSRLVKELIHRDFSWDKTVAVLKNLYV